MRLSYLLILLTFTSCSTTRKQEDINDKKFKLNALAHEKYDDLYLLSANKNEQYVLVINKTKKFSDWGFSINYFLYDLEEERILIEDYLASGKVEWISDYQIKTISRNPIPDQQGRRDKIIYFYNAQEGVKEYQN